MPYNYYPTYQNPYMYQQFYQNPIQQQQMSQQQQMPVQMQAQPQQQQIQNGGFISVRNEQDARNYPVAPGNSITFKDETAPYVYTKTMGFSQLDTPIFERYKLVKEETPDETLIEDKPITFTTQRKLEDEISHLWKEINLLKDSRKSTTKKEVTKNE